MDNQGLQDAFKSDLMTIPTLKVGILSAGDLYGTLAGFVLKLSLLLLGINVLIQAGLHSVGLFYWPLSIGLVFKCWLLTLAGSSFIMIFLSNFILFGKLVKGRLKTEAFIKQKCRHFGVAFLVIYIIAYLLLIMGINAFVGMSEGESEFGGLISIVLTLGFSQLVTLLGSMLVVNVIASMEISRLGMGIALDVIKAFVDVIKNHANQRTTHSDGSVDDAR